MDTFRTQSEQIDKIIPALFEAKKVIAEVPTKSDNLEFNSRYADYGAVWSACKQPLEDQQLMVIQAPVPSARDGCLALETKVVHVPSGQWIASLAEIPLLKRDPQAFGSALTYVRRYALCAVLGIVTKDDDANGAAGKERPQSHSEPPRPQQPPQGPPQQQRPNSQPRGPVGQPQQQRPQPFPSQPQGQQGGVLPPLSGVDYVPARGNDGQMYVKAVGQTWPHHQRLLNMGFFFSKEKKLYWKPQQQAA
ncbi:ERF family protein [Pseudodesulfovibrio pelocollis]|uniref:ERF family protein n=1 Tax=Pseudodesulfovibrio pelocollis TaxID=3051432 RepID=UPI00255AAA72|nr:ERF family protein [Pseudodesulfovibrio sp. SB368]